MVHVFVKGEISSWTLLSVIFQLLPKYRVPGDIFVLKSAKFIKVFDKLPFR